MKNIRVWNAILTAIAVAVGLITLLGYFVPVPTLLGLRLQFVGWAGLLAAWAVIIGAFNLLGVHWRRIRAQAPGWFYSLFLVGSLAAVLAVSIAAPFLRWGSGPGSVPNQWVFRYVVAAAATATFGLLAFILVFAGYRLLRRRPSVTLVAFIVVAIIALIGMAPLPAGLPDLGLRSLWLWIAQVPAMAGARGLLLGIALGVVATGLRVLLAVDRPYGE